ncbi:DUF2927 domain-containing protein [Actinoplanes solisilvae]|uniref:DUF2927 domain-containing protein n=1 Tax=Actinoplanes solisilvae TaxID=2486853 RepID=UPI000FDAE91A|nr:DUF2927 domain-containing protein [Actinoplanes solisilvae]
MRPTLGKGLIPALLLVGTLAACHAPAAGSPASPASSAPAPSASPTPSATTSPAPAPTRTKPTISKAGLSHFFTVALGAEIGSKEETVTLWNWPTVTVRVHGGSARNKSCVNKVIAEFNALTATTDLRLSTNPSDIELHIAQVSKFKSLDKSYKSGSDGWITLNVADTYALESAIVLVSSGIPDSDRCSAIRAELTEATGFMRDTTKRDSVFYREYRATKYSALDLEAIRLLYGGAVRAGDTKKQVTAKVTVK